jgi:hypothetical protein
MPSEEAVAQFRRVRGIAHSGSGAAIFATALPDLGTQAAGSIPVSATVPHGTGDSWKSGVSGTWATAANWTGGVPGALTAATIAAAGTYTVTINAAASAGTLTLTDSGATLAETAGGLTIGTSFAISSGAIYDLAADIGLSAGASAKITNAGVIEKTTGKNTSTLGGAVTSTGTILVNSGTLEFSNRATISGDLGGAGTVDFAGGAQISAGTTLSVGTLKFGGTLTLGAGLSYGGALVMNGGTLALGSNIFTLTGNTGDYLFEGEVSGTGTSSGATLTGTLVTAGTTALDGVEIDGDVTLANTGTDIVTGDYFTLDYAGFGTATLLNEAGATFDLINGADESTSIQNNVLRAAITNNGLFEATASGKTIYQSAIFAPFMNSNTGTILANTDILAFNGAATISGDVAGSGEVDFENGAQISAGTTLSVATLEFGGTLTLGAGLSYGGALVMNGGTLALGSNSFTLTGNTGDYLFEGEVSGTGTSSGATLTGTLVTAGTTALDGVEIDGGVTLANTGTDTVTGDYFTLDYAGFGTATLLNEAGATFDLIDGAGESTSIQNNVLRAAITNNGLFEATASGTTIYQSTIYAAFTNSSTGTILANTDTLAFNGAATISGDVAGSGEVDFENGAQISAGTTLSVATLEFGGTLTLGAGLSYGGALVMNGGTLALGSNSFTLTGNTGDYLFEGEVSGTGTSSGATLTGTLVTAGTTALDGVEIDGGVTLANTGTDTVTGDYFTLDYAGFGTATLLNEAGATFDLIDGAGESTSIQNNVLRAAITNNGLFEATASGTTIYQSTIYAAFTNSSTGTILANIDTLAFNGAATISGDVAGSGEVEFENGAQISAGTTLSVATLEFGGTLALGAGLSYGGALVMNGGTLSLGSNSFTLTGNAGDELSGGEVSGTGTSSGATLTGTLVTAGTTALDGLYIDGGVTLANTGTDTVTGDAFTLDWAGFGTTTLINEAGATFDLINGAFQNEASDNNVLQATIINSGLFEATSSTTGTTIPASTLYAPFFNTGSGTLLAKGDTLTLAGGLGNNGTVEALGRSTLLLSGGASNDNHGTLTGGTWIAAAQGDGATLDITGGTITTDAATITLSGTGATIAAGTSTYTALESSLATIAAAGVLNILNGRGYTTTLALTDQGLLDLGGGTLSIQTLTIAATGTLSGFGTVLTGIADAGEIFAAGGTLIMDQAITGAGTIGAALGATLDLTVGQMLLASAGAGTLQLDGAFALGAADAIATLLLDTGSSLSGPGTVDGALIDNGMASAATGTLAIGGALTGDGLLQAAAGAAIDLAGGNFAGTLGGAGTVQIGGDLILQAAADLTAGSVVISSGATLDLNGGGLLSGTIAGAGTLQLDGSTSYTLTSGNTPGVGAILVDAGVTLLGSGTLTAAVSGAGTLQLAQGAVLDLAGGGAFGGTIAGAGTLGVSGTSAFVVQPGATLSVASVTVAVGAMLDLNGGGNLGTISGTGTLQLDGTTPYTEPASLGFAKTLIDAGATLDLSAPQALTRAITGAGTLQLAAGTNTVAAGTTLSLGSILLGAGSTLSGAGTLVAAISNAGTLAASAGSLVIDGAVTGAGLLTAGTNAVLDLAGGGSLSGKITGAGTARLDGAAILTVTAETIAVSALSVDAGATLAGSGSVSSSITDAGTIEASGGKLLLTHAITGAGVLEAGSGATLDLTAGGELAQSIIGSGTLELGAAFTVGPHALTVSALKIDAGASLSGAGKITGTLADTGTIAAAGGTLILGGALTGTGTLSAGSGALLDISKGGSFSGAIGGAGAVELGAALSLTGTASLAAASFAEGANIKLGAGVSLTNAAADAFTITAAAGKVVELSGAAGDSFTNLGSLAATGAGKAEFGTAFINAGTVSGGPGTLAFLGASTNNGTIEAASVLTSFAASVAGTGTLEVAATGTLSLLLGAGSGQTVDFLATTGLLDLTKPLDFAGTIAGFGAGDQIDLLNTAANGLSYAGNVLTVTNGTTTVASLIFAGASNSFSLSSDLHGGTLISFG